MDTHHRKIELQSPADLTYLHENLRLAAREKLDLAIPPPSRDGEPVDSDDDFRGKVAGQVESGQADEAVKWISRTYALALPNLSINGLEGSPSLLQSYSALEPAHSPEDDAHAVYEAYDAGLAERLRDLYDELERETMAVAELRRTVPKRAGEAYAEGLRSGVAREREMWEMSLKGRESRFGEVKGEAEGLKVEGGDSGEMYGRGEEGLRSLMSIPETVARLERVKGVIDEVEARTV